MQKLVKASIQIGSGRLDTSIDVKGKDELGQLAKAFSQMTKDLKKTLVSRDDLRAEVEERKKTSAKLARALVDVQRSNKELEQFAYVASHDLRNRCAWSPVIPNCWLNVTQINSMIKPINILNSAVDGAVRMQRLINDLLTYSRINTQGQTPSSLIHMRSLVKQSVTCLLQLMRVEPL